MKFEEVLILGFSYKKTVTEVVEFLNKNPKQFSLFVKLLQHQNIKIASRASWIIGDILYTNPAAVTKVEAALIKALLHSEDEMILRNMVRIFQVAPISEKYQALVYDRCLVLIFEEKRGVAIRAFAMTVAANIAMLYPELKSELIETIQPTLVNASAGYLNRAKKELKRLGSR